MLSVPFKKTQEVSLSTPLRKYVSSSLSDADAEAYASDLDTLQSLRESVRLGLNDGIAPARELALYYHHLTQAEPYFPVSDSVARVRFDWQDAWRPSSSVRLSSLKYERAALLFNLGAVAAQNGARADRNTEEGLKIACKCFGQAAGCFQAIQDTIAAGIPGATTFDLSTTGLTLASLLMQAQTQACFFEKVMLDRKRAATSGGKPMKGSMVAGIAGKASEFYGAALRMCEAQGGNTGGLRSSFSNPIDTSWVAHLAFQQNCFHALEAYWAGQHWFEEGEATGTGYGKAIGWWAEAERRVLDAIAAGEASEVSATHLAGAESLRDNIQRQKRSVESDNAKVYHEIVPTTDRLPAIAKIGIAKPLPVAQLLLESMDSQVPQRLFPNMLPKEARAALMRYQRACAEVLARLDGQVKEKHADVRKQLAEAGLPGSVEHYALEEGDPRIPDPLWERISQATTLEPRLGELSNIVRQLSAETARTVNRVGEGMQREEAADVDFRSRRVSASQPWMGVSSSALLREYKKDNRHYAGLLEQARASDAQVLRQLADGAFQSQLTLLRQPRETIEASLPTTAPLSAEESSSGFIEPRPRFDTSALQAKLVLLAQTLSERERALGALRANTNASRLRQSLSEAAKEAGFGKPNSESLVLEEDMFERIADAEVQQIEMAQRAMMEALGQEAPLLAQTLAENERFRKAREVDPGDLERAGVFRQVEAAIVAVQTLAAQLGEGQRFYGTLNTRLARLQQLVSDAAEAQGLARSDYLEDIGALAERKEQEESDAALARKLAAEDSAAAGAASATVVPAAEEKLVEAAPKASSMDPKKWFAWAKGSKQDGDATTLAPPAPAAAAPAAAPPPAAPAASISLAPNPFQAQQAAAAAPSAPSGAPPSFASLNLGPAPSLGAPARGGGGGPRLGGASGAPSSGANPSVTRLVEMGFPRPAVEKALKQFSNDEEQALNSLLQG